MIVAVGVQMLVVKDVFGIEVSCTEEYWQYKVASRRPELAGRLPDAMQVVAKPDHTFPNVGARSDRLVYLRADNGGFLTVVAEYCAEGPAILGRLVTAFPQRSLRAYQRQWANGF